MGKVYHKPAPTPRIEALCDRPHALTRDPGIRSRDPRRKYYRSPVYSEQPRRRYVKDPKATQGLHGQVPTGTVFLPAFLLRRREYVRRLPLAPINTPAAEGQ